MSNEKNFLKLNLKNKVSLLQDEHKYVLKIIYDDACEKGVVNNFEYHEYLVQSMKYSDIREKAINNMSDNVLDICLLDLDRMGFIMNMMRNPYKCAEYSIWYLGLEYFKELS